MRQTRFSSVKNELNHSKNIVYIYIYIFSVEKIKIIARIKAYLCVLYIYIANGGNLRNGLDRNEESAAGVVTRVIGVAPRKEQYYSIDAAFA